MPALAICNSWLCGLKTAYWMAVYRRGMLRIISRRFKVARTCGEVPVLCTPRNFPPPVPHTAPLVVLSLKHRPGKARHSRRSARNNPENRRPPRPPAEIRARSSPRRRAAIPRAASRSGSRELLRALLLSVFRGHAVRAAVQPYSFVCPKGALHRRGKFGGRQESSRAAAIQGENGRRCFLPHFVVRSACRARRAGPQFFHALTCRRLGRCRPSLCRISLLSEENAGHG